MKINFFRKAKTMYYKRKDRPLKLKLVQLEFMKQLFDNNV